MKLKALDSPDLIQLASGWLAQKENYQWLDFGDGRQTLTPAWLKIMTQRDTNLLRVFAPADDHTPVGVVALSDINREFKTARIWVVAGDKSFRASGYATSAASAMLTVAFRDLGLQAVNTWIVDGNRSMRIADRLNFKPIGCLRECHYIDGRPHDRLWLDILASEHEES